MRDKFEVENNVKLKDTLVMANLQDVIWELKNKKEARASVGFLTRSNDYNREFAEFLKEKGLKQEFVIWSCSFAAIAKRRLNYLHIAREKFKTGVLQMIDDEFDELEYKYGSLHYETFTFVEIFTPKRVEFYVPLDKHGAYKFNKKRKPLRKSD